MRPAHRAQDGFTLIEVVVALAILALTFGFAYQGLSGGVGWMDRGRHRERALSLADSMLERVGIDIPLQDGALSGRTIDGYSWQIDVAPYGAPGRRRFGALAGHQVEIVVGWTDGAATRQIRLVTVRLAPQSAGQGS